MRTWLFITCAYLDTPVGDQTGFTRMCSMYVLALKALFVHHQWPCRCVEGSVKYIIAPKLNVLRCSHAKWTVLIFVQAMKLQFKYYRCPWEIHKLMYKIFLQYERAVNSLTWYIRISRKLCNVHVRKRKFVNFRCLCACTGNCNFTLANTIFFMTDFSEAVYCMYLIGCLTSEVHAHV